MNYVKVTFNSAKLPIVDKFSNCDYVHDKNGYRERPESEFVDINDPIKFEPICNMLHVLFGERPVASLRGNGLPHLNKEIEEIAMGGYMKIDTPFSYKDLSGNTRAIKECTQGKKVPYDSHAKLNCVRIGDDAHKGMFTWDLIKRRYMYDDDKYKKVVYGLEKYSGIKDLVKNRNVSAADALEIIRNSDCAQEAAEYFKSIELTPAATYISTGVCDFSNFTSFKSKLGAMLVNRYVLEKITLSGEFLFPVTDEQYEKLAEYSGRFATYLDGGIAKLEMRKLDIPKSKLYEYKQIKDFKRLCE